MKLDGEIKVNGRTHYFKRVRGLNRIDPGRYVVETTIGRFAIGRNLGKPRDWFLECPKQTTPFACVSVIDALRYIESM